MVARKNVVSVNDYEKKLFCGNCRFFTGPKLKLSKLEQRVLERYDRDPEWLLKYFQWVGAQSKAEVEKALRKIQRILTTRKPCKAYREVKICALDPCCALWTKR